MEDGELTAEENAMLDQRLADFRQNEEGAAILIEEWQGARDRHGCAIGRDVIMPDHVHFF